MCVLNGIEYWEFHLDVTSCWIVVGDVYRVAIWLVLADGHLCQGNYVGLNLIEGLIGSNWMGLDQCG